MAATCLIYISLVINTGMEAEEQANKDAGPLMRV